MKKVLFCMLVGLFAMFFGCQIKDNQPVQSQYGSDIEMIEALINFSLINAEDADKFIVPGDDATVIKMIMDYNLVNDNEQFSVSNSGGINNKALLEKILMLSNNLQP
jgi:hypothetical protein